MKNKDYTNETPYYDNGVTKWYYEKYLTNYIRNEQDFNLPKLSGLGCFVTLGVDINDLVLVNDKQEVVKYYPHNISGLEQMKYFINMLKISKYYDECEKV